MYSSVFDFLPSLTRAIRLRCLLFVFCSWIRVHWHHKTIYSGRCGNGIGFRNDVSLIRMQEEAQQVASRTLFQVMLLKFSTSSDKLCDEGAALHNVLCCSYDGFHCVARKPLSSTQFQLMKYVFLRTVCLSRRKLCCHVSSDVEIWFHLVSWLLVIQSEVEKFRGHPSWRRRSVPQISYLSVAWDYKVTFWESWNKLPYLVWIKVKNWPTTLKVGTI